MNFSPKPLANWEIVEMYTNCIKASVMNQWVPFYIYSVLAKTTKHKLMTGDHNQNHKPNQSQHTF